MFEALGRSLTDSMLDEHFDGPQRHVTQGYLFRGSDPPLLRSDDLEELFDNRKDIFFGDDALSQVVFSRSRTFPDAFQDQLGVLGLEILLGIPFREFESERLKQFE
jgi:hypothetical protein